MDPAGINAYGPGVVTSNDPSGAIGLSPEESISYNQQHHEPVDNDLPPASLPSSQPPPTPRRGTNASSPRKFQQHEPSPVMAFLVGSPPPPPSTPPPNKRRSSPRNIIDNSNDRYTSSTEDNTLSSGSMDDSSISVSSASQRASAIASNRIVQQHRRRGASTRVENTNFVDRENKPPNPMTEASPRSAATEPHSNTGRKARSDGVSNQSQNNNNKIPNTNNYYVGSHTSIGASSSSSANEDEIESEMERDRDRRRSGQYNNKRKPKASDSRRRSTPEKSNRRAKTPERKGNRRRSAPRELSKISENKANTPSSGSDKEKRSFFRLFRGGKKKNTDRSVDSAKSSSEDDLSGRLPIQPSSFNANPNNNPKSLLKVTFKEEDEVLNNANISAPTTETAADSNIDYMAPGIPVTFPDNQDKNDPNSQSNYLSSTSSSSSTDQSEQPNRYFVGDSAGKYSINEATNGYVVGADQSSAGSPELKERYSLNESSVSSSSSPERSNHISLISSSSPELNKNSEGNARLIESITHSVPHVEDDHLDEFANDEVSTLTTPSILSSIVVGRRSLGPPEDISDDQSSDPIGVYWDREKKSKPDAGLTAIDENSFREPDGDYPLSSREPKSSKVFASVQDPAGDSPEPNKERGRKYAEEPTPRGVGKNPMMDLKDPNRSRQHAAEPTPRGIGNPMMDFKDPDRNRKYAAEPTPRGAGNPLMNLKDPVGYESEQISGFSDPDVDSEPATEEESVLHDDMGIPISASSLSQNLGLHSYRNGAVSAFGTQIPYGGPVDQDSKGINPIFSRNITEESSTDAPVGLEEESSIASPPLPVCLTHIRHRTNQNPRARKEEKMAGLTLSIPIDKSGSPPERVGDSSPPALALPVRSPPAQESSDSDFFQPSDETDESLPESKGMEVEDGAQLEKQNEGRITGNPLLSMSAAARLNAKAFAYLHTLNGEPSPIRAWRSPTITEDYDYGPKKKKHTAAKIGQPPQFIRVDKSLIDDEDPSTHDEDPATHTKNTKTTYNSKFRGRKPTRVKSSNDDDLLSHAEYAEKVAFTTYNSKFRGRKPTKNKKTSNIPINKKPTFSRRNGKEQRLHRNIEIDSAAVAFGIEVKRQIRNDNIACGLATRVVPSTRKMKPKRKNSSVVTSDDDDPIQRAGRRLLSKAAIPIQSAARNYLARREAMNRMWALIEIQSYFRRWRCEAYRLAYKNSATQIQSISRGWKARRSFADHKHAATQIQRITRGYLAARCVYDAIYWVTRLQSVVRRKLARLYFARKKEVDNHGALVIQTAFRSYMAKVKASKRRKSVCMIQSKYRSYTARIQYQVTVVDIIITQSIVRQRLAQNIYKERVIEKMNESACTIQAAWRGFQGYNEYIFTLVDILVLQRNFRKWLAISKLRSMKKESAAIKIQKNWRRHMAQLTVLIDLVHIIIVQSVARRQLAKAKYQELKKEQLIVQREEEKIHRSATKIQNSWRGFWHYSHFLIMQYEVVRLQAIVRGRIARTSYSLCLGCCLMIQSVARRYLARKEASRRRMQNEKLDSAAQALRERLSIQRIQFWWRVVLDCAKEKKAALTIERFFIMVKREVEREMLEIGRKKSRDNRRNKKEPDDKLLERAWLKTVAEGGDDLFAYSSCGGSTKKSLRTPRLRSASSYVSDSSSDNDFSANVTDKGNRKDNEYGGTRHRASSPSMDLVMRHEKKRSGEKDLDPPDSVQLSLSDDKSDVSCITSPSAAYKRKPARRSKMSQEELSQDLSLEEAFLDVEVLGKKGSFLDVEVLDRKDKKSSYVQYAKKYGLKTQPSSSTRISRGDKKKQFFVDESDNNRSRSARSSKDRAAPTSPAVSIHRSHSRGGTRSHEESPESPEAIEVSIRGKRSGSRSRSRSQSRSRKASSHSREEISHSTRTRHTQNLSSRHHPRESPASSEKAESIVSLRRQELFTPQADKKYGPDKYALRSFGSDSASVHSKRSSSRKTDNNKNRSNSRSRRGNRRDDNNILVMKGFPDQILRKDSQDNVEIEYLGRGADFGDI